MASAATLITEAAADYVSRTGFRWSDTARARTLLARITPHQLHVSFRRGIWEDRFVLLGEPVEKLERLRSELVAQAFGCSFDQADRAGRTREYLAFLAEQPDAQDVLFAQLGNPNAMGFAYPYITATLPSAEWTRVWRGRALKPMRSAAA